MKALLKALEKAVVLVLYTANYVKKRRFYDNFTMSLRLYYVP